MMTLEEAQEAWTNQPESTNREVDRMIGTHRESTRRLLFASKLMFVIALASAALIFYGAYVQQRESFLLASMRVGTLMVGVVPHVLVTREVKRRREEWDRCRLDQKQCLQSMIDQIRAELHPSRVWQAIGWCSLIVSMVAITKWLDFRSGGDSLAEGVAIVGVAVSFFVILGLFAAHHRSVFVAPRLERLSSVLRDLETE